MTPCAPIELTHPPIPFADWPAPASPWRLQVPRALRSFRSGEWHMGNGEGGVDHGHHPLSVSMNPTGCSLLFCEPAGPYLVACVQRTGFRPLLLDRRTGRVLREAKITEPWNSDFEDSHEGLVQRRARAIESAALAVLTLRERYVGGHAHQDGESWLRQQLSTLREDA